MIIFLLFKIESWVIRKEHGNKETKIPFVRRKSQPTISYENLRLERRNSL